MEASGLADRTVGSSRGMGRASGPSPRRPNAAAPMRRLLSAAGPVRGFLGASGRLSVSSSTIWFPCENLYLASGPFKPPPVGPQRAMGNQELKNRTKAVGMLSGFRIRPSEFQVGWQAVKEHIQIACRVSTATPRFGNTVR